MIRSLRSLPIVVAAAGILMSATTAVNALGGPPIPAPMNVTVNASCHGLSVTWTGASAVLSYEYQLTRNGSLVSGSRTVQPNASFPGLDPGKYVFQVKALAAPGPFSDSGFSSPVTGEVEPCLVCTAPHIALDSVDPSLLWPPNGRTVPVTVKGSAGANCPLDRVDVTVESEGSGPQEREVSLLSDGSFVTTFMLQASRSGTEKESRVYTLSAKATNGGGTGESNSLSVTVPHDQGKK